MLESNLLLMWGFSSLEWEL
ncbi:hypothetical protein Godav_001606 [Gossypium davidsonii]|uniref:Uncharacterized protein n=1 Tax=Gossypium davidsonii TaxID=34287 RepID=A0A7J8T3L8_GOSDV|nr:hypothetical protein [Gossypium davidsonii]